MTTETPQALVDLSLPGWAAPRQAAALAVAAPNDRRIAAAAAGRLTPADHAAAFAAWCDLQPAPDTKIAPS